MISRTINVNSLDLYLIFIKLTVFIGRFSFILKGNNNKTDEYIDHEEGYDDDVDEVKASYYWSIIMNGPHILLVRVYRYVQNAIKQI